MTRPRTWQTLALDATGLPTVALGESRQLRPGQWVIALGHPSGIRGAVTAGVVIGVGTGLPEAPNLPREWTATNLPLRPGNSGGPLVGARGRLVGINTMITGPEVGLAVPVHAVKAFLRESLGSPKGRGLVWHSLALLAPSVAPPTPQAGSR